MPSENYQNPSESSNTPLRQLFFYLAEAKTSSGSTSDGLHKRFRLDLEMQQGRFILSPSLSRCTVNMEIEMTVQQHSIISHSEVPKSCPLSDLIFTHGLKELSETCILTRPQ